MSDCSRMAFHVPSADDRIVTEVMHADLEANGPLPGDPWTAYLRGVRAAITRIACIEASEGKTGPQNGSGRLYGGFAGRHAGWNGKEPR